MFVFKLLYFTISKMFTDNTLDLFLTNSSIGLKTVSKTCERQMETLLVVHRKKS